MNLSVASGMGESFGLLADGLAATGKPLYASVGRGSLRVQVAEAIRIGLGLQ